MLLPMIYDGKNYSILTNKISSKLIDYYSSLTNKYPIKSIEDQFWRWLELVVSLTKG